MTTYESGAAVHGGFYLNPSRWTMATVAHGGRLPAGPGCWLRVPAVLALLLTPVLGAMFVVALPVLGFVLAARALGTAGARIVSARGTAAERRRVAAAAHHAE